MTFNLLIPLILILTPAESLLENFKYNVNLIYSFQLSKKVPPEKLIKETDEMFRELREVLPPQYSIQKGFSWSKRGDYFIGKISEYGDKEAVIITGEKVKFKYVIYDDVIVPLFENIDRYDGISVKTWVDEDGRVNILRNEYYRDADRIWNGEVLNPFAMALFMKEYGGVIKKLKENRKGLNEFRTIYFKRETSDMALPEETFHIKFPDICEREAEILARLHRLWFNPTYSFLGSMIISAGKIAENPDEKWVEGANLPHTFSARWILYTIFKTFRLQSYQTLTQIPLQSLSALAEKEFFDELSRARNCFPFR